MAPVQEQVFLGFVCVESDRCNKEIGTESQEIKSSVRSMQPEFKLCLGVKEDNTEPDHRIAIGSSEVVVTILQILNKNRLNPVIPLCLSSILLLTSCLVGGMSGN